MRSKIFTPMRIISITSIVLLVIYFVYFKPRTHRFAGSTMGTRYNVTYQAPWWQVKKQQAINAVHNAVTDIDQRMSTYKYNSELMQFNRAEIGKPFKLSQDIVKLIQTADKISEISNGAYDITIGPVVNLWGFGPSIKHLTQEVDPSDENIVDNIKNIADFTKHNQPPQHDAIQAALKKVGYKSIIIDSKNSTVTKTKDIFIDLSSIAKGYGVDQAALALEALGINNYSVEIGGEIRVKGKNPSGKNWTIAILSPKIEAKTTSAIIHLNNQAMATSGDYLNYFEIDGKRYSHAINPNTGFPKISDIAEVTVIADDTFYADALSTMFMMLGDEIGIKLANDHNIPVYFIKYTDDKEEGIDVVYSKCFARYLQN